MATLESWWSWVRAGRGVRHLNSISALPEGAGSLLIHVGYLLHSMLALNDGSLRVVLVQGGVFHPCDENGHGDV